MTVPQFSPNSGAIGGPSMPCFIVLSNASSSVCSFNGLTSLWKYPSLPLATSMSESIETLGKELWSSSVVSCRLTPATKRRSLDLTPGHSMPGTLEPVQSGPALPTDSPGEHDHWLSPEEPPLRVRREPLITTVAPPAVTFDLKITTFCDRAHRVNEGKMNAISSKRRPFRSRWPASP